MALKGGPATVKVTGLFAFWYLTTITTTIEVNIQCHAPDFGFELLVGVVISLLFMFPPKHSALDAKQLLNGSNEAV